MKFTFKRYIPFLPLLVFLRQSIVLGGISPRKLPLFCAYILRFILFEPLRWLEVLLFERRIQGHALKKDPIFILGHWRSGTSHVQQILSLDPKHVSLNLYEMLSPDHFMVSEAWLLPLLNRIIRLFGIRYAFQRRPLDLRLCGELDTALCSLGSTQAYTWGHLFPKIYRTWMDARLFNSPQNIELSDYDYLIRKLSFQSGNKRVVVKSPGDTARISALLKRYPKATFISISRSSYVTYESNLYLWNAIQRENSLQIISQKDVSALVTWTYPKLMEAYEKMKSDIPEGQLSEICFDALHVHPADTVLALYGALNLGSYPEMEFTRFFDENKTHRAQEYPLDEGLLKSLKQSWGAHFKD